jgi:hypothetical protein
MNTKTIPKGTPSIASTRRQVITGAGAALGIGGLIIRPEPSFTANRNRVYGALTDSQNELIVQAWRTQGWRPFDHTGFPNGEAEHLAAGSQANYWPPIEKFLA